MGHLGSYADFTFKVKFTVEFEDNNTIPTLDILIKRHTF